jgi:hypothetical protein
MCIGFLSTGGLQIVPSSFEEWKNFCSAVETGAAHYGNPLGLSVSIS